MPWKSDQPAASLRLEFVKRVLSHAKSKAAMARARHKPSRWRQVAAKGWFRISGGRECHPLNVVDDHSRFCVRSVALPSQTPELALGGVLSAFAKYGLPRPSLATTARMEGFPLLPPYGLAPVRA